MPTDLVTMQRGTLNLRRLGDRLALTGWLNTVDTHLYRLYLITGSQDFLMALSTIGRLRDEAATHSRVLKPSSLQELIGQLHRVLEHLHPEAGTGQHKRWDLQP